MTLAELIAMDPEAHRGDMTLRPNGAAHLIAHAQARVVPGKHFREVHVLLDGRWRRVLRGDLCGEVQSLLIVMDGETPEQALKDLADPEKNWNMDDDTLFGARVTDDEIVVIDAFSDH